MSMLRYYQPGSFINELQKELFPLISWANQDLSQTKEATWLPKVDIKEEADEFVLYADIPGIDPKDIDINMEESTLTIKGERKDFQEEHKEKKYYRIERSFGKFYRQFTLPETVESSKITAKSKNGVLAIHLPKAKEAKHQRKINIQEE